MLELNQRDERFRGSGITSFKFLLNLVAASAMNFVWNGTPNVLKMYVEMPSAFNFSTNFVTGSALPQIYAMDLIKIGSTVNVSLFFVWIELTQTAFSLLFAMMKTSSGKRLLASSRDKPIAADSLGTKSESRIL